MYVVVDCIEVFQAPHNKDREIRSEDMLGMYLEREQKKLIHYRILRNDDLDTSSLEKWVIDWRITTRWILEKQNLKN